MDVAILAAILGVAGAAVLGLRRRTDPTRLALAKVEPTPPTAMVDGAIVIVRGTVSLVEPGAELTSPIWRRPCVYWRVTFEEIGIGADFVELGQTEQSVPFLVTSEAGAARVVPEYARVAVPRKARRYPASALDNSWYSDPGINLARSVCKRPNYPTTSSLRVTEYVVTTEMNVTVQGYCTKEPDPKGAEDVTGYRADVPMRTVVSGTKRSPLLLVDYNRVSVDGQ